MATASSPSPTSSAAPAAGAGRSIMRTSNSTSGLLARRRSRSRNSASTSSSVTFDLALEIPHESHAIDFTADATTSGPQFSRSNSIRQVHRIEHESQLVLRQCFRMALSAAQLGAEQSDQMIEALDSSSTDSAERCPRCLNIASVMSTISTEMRSTKHGLVVIRRAKRVSLQSMNRSQFERHVTEVAEQHRAGDHRARIGSVLLFCTQLALSASESSDRLAFCQVLNWSLDYFRRTVSAWVVRAGGWDNAIQEPNKVVASIAFVLSVLLFGRAILRLINCRGC